MALWNGNQLSEDPWISLTKAHEVLQKAGQRQFQTRGGIYRVINQYKPSCHKQVSDTQNVWNCHKQVLNYETIWNFVPNYLQYITYVNKNAEKNLVSFLTSIKSLDCIIINVWAFD